MSFKKTRNFCDINPFFYAISKQKEILKRLLKDLFSNEKFAKKRKSIFFRLDPDLILNTLDDNANIKEKKQDTYKLFKLWKYDLKQKMENI